MKHVRDDAVPVSRTSIFTYLNPPALLFIHPTVGGRE